ncbi:ankyrin repeat domain-containing protein [Microbacterium sp. GXF6406]
MNTRFLLATAATASIALLLAGCAVAEPRPEPSIAAPAVDDAEQQAIDEKLIAAAWANDIDEATRLIDEGADVNAKDTTEQSAYLIATSEGYLPLLELTLQHGADVGSLDSWNGTGLIRAAERGHANIVGRLIQAGIDQDHVNRLGWVALHEALVFAKAEQPDDYIDTVRVLAAGGADMTIPSEQDGLTPLELAQQNGLDAQARIIRAAVDSEADASDADRRLLDAAETGDADAAALALRAGADIEARNDLQQTPLLLAAANDRVDVARLLVALGADPDALDHQHDTPWLVTGVTGSVAMLEALLPANPDMTIPNRFGGLSPIPAGERGHAAYIERVAQTDVDLNHVNNLGWTALLEAVIFGDGSERYVDIVTTLVDAGADISIPDKNGATALDHARDQGQTGVVRVLESAG